MNCMELLENDEDICSKCGYEVDEEQSLPFIPKGTVLENRYIVGRGLEIDGEGLSYIGYDKSKKTKVYIREFYPSNFSSRSNDGVGVTTKENFEKVFKNLRSGFFKYFRFVARVRNLPSVVSVYDIFEANNTIYVICEWVDGSRLDRFLGSKGGRLEWNEAKEMFMPFLNSLSRMEAVGIRHLGISPDNILVTKDNEFKLTGFATKSLRSANSLISSQLYDGCTALEQYLDDYEPAESTDVYGLAATLFFALTGEYPPSAVERKKDDKLMMPQVILNDLPENVVSAIATALRVYPNSRTLSFETLKIELSDSPLLEVQDIESNDDVSEITDYGEEDFRSEKSKSISWGVVSCIITLVVLLVCLGVYWFWLKNKPENDGADENSSSQSQADSYLKNENTNTQDETTRKITVPNLVGRNFKSLQDELKYNNEYNVVLLSEEFSSEIGEGCIISQTPSAGEEAYYGTMIAVNVSKGKKTKSLPSVEGKTLSEASQLLAENKIKTDSVSEFSSKYPEGTVVGYKNYKAGDEVEYGSQVTLIVSKGET